MGVTKLNGALFISYLKYILFYYTFVQYWILRGMYLLDAHTRSDYTQRMSCGFARGLI